MTRRPTGGDPRADQVAEAKAELRRAVRERRGSRAESCEANEARLGAARELNSGISTVACYASLPGEPDTWPLIDALHETGVSVLLPVLGRRADGSVRRDPDWGWYAGRERLRPGFRGIPEPIHPGLGAEALVGAEFIWCPGLAATPSGDRLGTGGAWYDRALRFASPAATIGLLLHDDEVLDSVPTEATDRRVDLIVTESQVIVCSEYRTDLGC